VPTLAIRSATAKLYLELPMRILYVVHHIRIRNFCLG